MAETVKFKCSACGEVFDSGWTVERAAEQLRILFMHGKTAENIICRACFDSVSSKPGRLPRPEDFS